MKTLSKISLHYWLQHKQRLFTLALTIVIGVASLCCSALLIRSEKQAVLEEYLNYFGNYDVMM